MFYCRFDYFVGKTANNFPQMCLTVCKFLLTYCTAQTSSETCCRGGMNRHVSSLQEFLQTIKTEPESPGDQCWTSAETNCLSRFILLWEDRAVRTQLQEDRQRKSVAHILRCLRTKQRCVQWNRLLHGPEGGTALIWQITKHKVLHRKSVASLHRLVRLH